MKTLQVATAEPNQNSKSHLSHLSGTSSPRLLAWVCVVFVATIAESASHDAETDDSICDSLQTVEKSPLKW